MAKLPRSLQEQLEAADAILALQNKPATPQPQDPGANEQPELPDAHIEEAVTAPQAEPKPEPPKPTDWEHKFKTLQGIFNAEVPRLQQQVGELMESNKVAAKRLEDAAAKPAETAKPEEQATDPRDVDAFGEDLVGMVQRMIKSSLGTIGAQLKRQAADIETRLAQVELTVQGTAKTVEFTVEEAFFSRLAKQVPDWEEINRDERFLTWLAEVDPVYGQPRQAALMAAQKSLDADRATSVFTAFKNTLPKPPKPNPLNKQVSPRPGASAQVTPTEPPVYTEKQVTDFFLSVSKGHYRGREQEAAEITALIDTALAEQRIR